MYGDTSSRSLISVMILKLIDNLLNNLFSKIALHLYRITQFDYGSGSMVLFNPCIGPSGMTNVFIVRLSFIYPDLCGNLPIALSHVILFIIFILCQAPHQAKSDSNIGETRLYFVKLMCKYRQVGMFKGLTEHCNVLLCYNKLTLKYELPSHSLFII